MAAIIQTDCPSAADLRKLIDGSAAMDDQSRITAHLDCCETCQQSIERLAGSNSRLLECASGAKAARPGGDSAYWPALRQLERAIIKVPNSSMSTTRAEVAGEATPHPDSAALDFLDPAEQPGTIGKLGRFHIVEQIGYGGMGIVLRALDVCLQRHVALKVLNPKYAKSELARNRFIREARAAASIAHENVVAIHHVEKHRDEIPYLVMRLITGESLQDRLDAKSGPLDVREIVEIGQQTAAGLAAAHEQTLIHRDIKPANILLEAGSGKVLLTDFGLARAAEDARLTQTGFVAGTPLYMSPEQARGEALDHRSDLFSFGSVLYAMCTGTPPFQGSSPFVVLRAVTEVPHRPIHEINPKVPDELIAIIDRLLAKKPEDRIQSAREVDELLSTLRTHLPKDSSAVVKRTTRTLPRLQRIWWGRNGGLIAASFVMASALLLLSEATKLTAWTVIGQRGRPVETAHSADTANVENDPKPKLVLDAGTGPVWSVAYSPDGETLAMAVDDGSVRLWNAKTGQLKSRIEASKRPIWSVAFNHDGALLVTASEDGNIRLWDPNTNKELDMIALPSPVRTIAISPDGERIAAGTRNGHVRIYFWKTGKMMTTTNHTGAVMSLAWSRDGKLLASASGDMTVKVWDVSGEESKLLNTLSGHTGAVYSVAFHPEKRVVASGSWDRTIRLWDIDMNKSIGKLEGHREDVWAVSFCSTGAMLASASEDRTVKIWDVATEKELKTFNAHVGTIYGLAMSPAGRTLATGGRDGTVKLWDIEEPEGHSP